MAYKKLINYSDMSSNTILITIIEDIIDICSAAEFVDR